MNRKSKAASLFLAIAMIFGLTAGTASAASPIRIVIDGNEIKSDVAPVIENGRTLVPLRVISEALGAEVEWAQSTRQATIKTAAYTVVFTLDSARYTVNGAAKTLEVPAKTINDRTMIPIRAFAESIGAEVDYSNNTAYINYFTTISGSVKVSGSTTVQPIMEAAARKLESMNSGKLSITVAGGGSGAGMNDTKSGANNIGMSSSSISADDATVVTPYVIAKDAIAIIVHPTNPVISLSKEEIMQIFTGEIKNWNEVGGNNAPILIHTRETGSGTLASLEDLLLNKEKVVERATPYASAGLLKNAVAGDPNGIGFDSIGFVDSTVKALRLENIPPSSTTVNSGLYQASRSLYVFTKGAPGAAEAKIIDYLRSAECQKEIVVKEGYVALGI
ncbi:MAG: stalk domain-containing protein [Oscillospiraceae bacterium]|nr:stalk domain-containing protein [Oscillospiraceae bacterium]